MDSKHCGEQSELRPTQMLCAGFSTARVSGGRVTEIGQWSLQPGECFKEDLVPIYIF
jgi:hypothetical protein